MKDLRKKWARAMLISFVACTGFILIVSEPNQQETWYQVFIGTKLLGFAFWGITYLLIKRWGNKGLLPDFMEEEY